MEEMNSCSNDTEGRSVSSWNDGRGKLIVLIFCHFSQNIEKPAPGFI